MPGFTTRRVQTEVELEAGQSFVIAGLLDNQTTETLNKIPGLGNIPILGKLFQSRAKSKNNTRTAGDRDAGAGAADSSQSAKPPELTYTTSFLEPNSHVPLRQPGMDQDRSRCRCIRRADHAGRAIDASSSEAEGQSRAASAATASSSRLPAAPDQALHAYPAGPNPVPERRRP